MKQYYAQHAKMIVKPGKRDEVIQQLNANMEVLGRIPGCIYYLISTTEEPDTVWISELWTSKAAKEALAKSPETAKGMQELMPLIASIADQAVMTVAGGFGLE